MGIINWHEIYEVIFEDVEAQIREQGYALDEIDEIGGNQVAAHFGIEYRDLWDAWWADTHWYEVAPM